MSLKVKICGVTSLSHVKASINGNAEMIGLMFYKKSPRYIDLKKAKKISEYAEKKIKRVGVVANIKFEEIKKITSLIKLDYLQFHGSESFEFIKKIKKKLKIKIIKALKIENINDIKKIEKFRKVSDFILIDSKIIKKNNINFKKRTLQLNTNIIKKIKNKKSLILSGGLNINNVYKSVKESGIKFIDVSSSLENKIGKKNIKKIDNFLKITTKL